MADYVIKFTDPLKSSFIIKPFTTDGPLTPNSAVPLDPQAVSAHTSLILLGKGMFEYGERTANDFVRMLENFANATSPAYPIEGQIWFKNTAPKGLFVYDGTIWQTIIVSSLPATGDLDMGGFKIVNLGTPTVGTDATNKTYVDGRVLDDLTDVIITAPFAGQILSFDGANWINTASGAPTTLAGLTDVSIIGPTNGQVLTYNFGISKWENVTPAADRYVNGAALTSNVLTLSFSTGGPTVTASGFAMVGDKILSPDVLHNVFYPAGPSGPGIPTTTVNSSYFRQQNVGPYPQALYPGAVTVEKVLEQTDQVLYDLKNQPVDRTILQGDGVITSFTLSDVYTTGTNKLMAYLNGIKQYASQRFSMQMIMNSGSSINEGTDTGLVDGTFSFSIQVDGTVYSGGSAPTVTVQETRTILAVSPTPTNTWTVATTELRTYSTDELGPGTYITVSGNGFGPANTTYKVLSAVIVGPNTVITIDTTDGSPAIPVGATATGTLRKGYIYQQLLEDLDASFISNVIPATFALHDSVIAFRSNDVGSGSIVYIDPAADTLFSACSTFQPATFNYRPVASIVGNGLLPAGIDAALTGPNPDEFVVFGDYTSSFTTGVRFVVRGSTSNDKVYITVADATFALGQTTIYVTDGSIPTNEPSPTGTGSIYFARFLGYAEGNGTPTAVGVISSQITFAVAPADGAVIEVFTQS